jgi:hypothetical protein
MFRFKRLVQVLVPQLDGWAVAVARWMLELELWLEIFYPIDEQVHEFLDPEYGAFDYGGTGDSY